MSSTNFDLPEPKPMHSSLPDSSNLITATLHKEYGTDGGITLRSFGGRLIISHVSHHTSRETGLKRGLEVVTMNNVDCSVLSAASAQKLLEGDEMVTFLVKELPTASVPGTLVTSVMFKEEQDSPVGMGIKIVGGQVCVGTIKPGSLAATSDLKTGLVIKSINNFDCVGLNSNQAAKLLADARGKLEILAQVPGAATSQRMTDHTTVTVTLDDELDVDSEAGEEPETGIELMTANSLENGKPMIVIKSLSQQSPFFGSALRVGMKICNVMNIDCTDPGIKAEEVSNILKDNTQQGETVMILAKSCGNAHRAPGSFLTVVVKKESTETKLGIILATKADKTMVKKIADGSLGSTTELEPGMWVHSINNHSLAGKSSKEAADILGQAEGNVTFLVQTPGGSSTVDPAQLVTATMVKEGDAKVGVALKAKTEQLVITKNVDGGLAYNTALEVGMRVMQINNVCMAGKSNKEAAEMLTSANGLLTVLAAKPDRPAGTFVVASIEIPTVSEFEDKPSIGLKMKGGKDGNYYISGITSGSLAATTDLKEGMILKSVNNVDCASKKSLKDVLGMFQQTSGILNVLAATPGGNPLPVSRVVTGCCMTGKNVPEGSIIYDEATGKIMITDTGAGGVMFGTALRAGMEILAINNVDASLFSKVGLENILKSQEKLIFLAKRQELPKDMLITETLHKETSNSPLGIGLKASKGKIYISSIKDGTLASTSSFLPGMELVSVDNEDCVGMDAMILAKALRDAVGDITIVASTKEGGLSKNAENVSLVTAVIDKGDKDNKVGVAFVRKRGMLVITKIAEGTAAAETDLLVGMDVLSINNVDVAELSSKEASSLLAEAEGKIAVLAKRPALPPGSFVTAAIVKEEGTSIGVKMCGLRGGGVMIKSVTPQSPASFTELEEGMVIRSINNVNTTKMTTKECAALLTADVPSLTILAQTTKEVAMGRASFRSMRSLTSGRSLGESISTYSLSASQHEPVVEKEVAVEAPMKKDLMVRPASPDLSADPIKTMTPPESPVSRKEETITVVSGGKRASFTVRNVVDC